MAPIWFSWLSSPAATQLLERQGDDSAASRTPVAAYLAAQWRNPGDILSVLLLVGPDVIKNATAQLSGRFITPVAFSFGWVAYAPAALLSSFGDGRLMPESDSTLLVIEPNSCHTRQTRNWILGRLWRDFNSRLDDELKDEQQHEARSSGRRDDADPGKSPPRGADKGGEHSQAQSPHFEALRVTVFEFEDGMNNREQGVPVIDWVWLTGILVIAVQLAIAVIPWALDGEWSIFLVTAAGNLFAVISGSLPQWRREKWACPKNRGPTVAITEGNGSRSVMVILSKPGAGLHLEVLAGGTRTATASRFTMLVNSALAVLWILLLITVQAIEQNAWYLLGIGMLGSIQNMVAASVPRSPAALGIHIREKEIIKGRRVAEALKQVETKYPLLGTALMDVFFPGSLRVDKENDEDISFWRAALNRRYEENKHGIRLDRLPPEKCSKTE